MKANDPRRRETVIIFDQGIDILGHVPILLKNREIIHANSLDAALDAQEKHNSDLLLCSLILSHSVDLEYFRSIIARLTLKFRNIGFFEPNFHGSKYLQKFGLKSFHTGFDVNLLASSLNVDLLLEHSPAYSVTHFGCAATYDSNVVWIVPSNHPRNTFPDLGTRDPGANIIEFEQPVFEFSCFLYSSYDARTLDLEDDLFFIEQAVRKSALYLSGVDRNQWILLRDAGSQFYETPKARLESRHGHELTSVHRREVDQAGATEAAVETKWLGTRDAPPLTMYVGCLQDCVVTGRGGVLAKKRLVADSSYLLYPPEPVRMGMRRRHHLGRIEGLALLTINSNAHNYYHWLIQLLPLIDVAGRKLREAGEDAVTVVTGRTSRFHHEYIRLLLSDFREVEVVSLKRYEYLTVSRGLYSNLAGREGPHNLFDEHLQMASILKQRSGIKEASPNRHIYISRNDGNGRTVKNEAELIDQMRARGFEILTLSDMALRDQMLAFSNARIVVGAHGAGLTNILYSSEQTTMIEFLQSTYANDCMLRLARNVGARHIAMFCFPDEQSAPYPGDWCVDIDRACALVDRVLTEAGRQAAA